MINFLAGFKPTITKKPRIDLLEGFEPTKTVKPEVDLLEGFKPTIRPSLASALLGPAPRHLGLRRPATRAEKLIEAPVRGAAYTVASAPQVVGSLIQEFGERMEENPAYWDFSPTTAGNFLARKALAAKAKKTDVDERIAEMGKGMVRRNQELIKRAGLQPVGGDNVENFLFNLGSGATTLGGAVGLSLLTKSPHAAAVAFGVYQKGHLYQEARAAGVAPEKAGKLSTTGGAVEGGLEYIGLNFMLKRYGGRMLSAAIRSGTEAFQEFSQELGQNIIARLGWDKTRNLLQGTGQAAAIGAILGTPTSIAISAAEESGAIAPLEEIGIDVKTKQGKELIKRIIEKQRAGIVNVLESEAGFAKIGEGEMPEELAKKVEKPTPISKFKIHRAGGEYGRGWEAVRRMSDGSVQITSGKPLVQVKKWVEAREAEMPSPTTEVFKPAVEKPSAVAPEEYKVTFPAVEKVKAEIEKKLRPKVSRLELERRARERVDKLRAEKREAVVKERVQRKETVRVLIAKHRIETVQREKKIREIDEIQLIKTKLRSEQIERREGKRLGRIETRKKIYKQIQAKRTEVADIKRSMVEYAKEHLTTKDRGKLLSRIAVVNTKRGLARGMQMIDVMEERYQRHTAVDNLKKTVKGIDFKRLRPEYKATIEDLSKSMDLVNRREQTITKLDRMAKYIADNPDHNIPDKHLRKLEILARTPLKNVTTEDVDLINTSITNLAKLHDLKNKIVIKRKIRDLGKARDESVVNIKKRDPADVDPRQGIRISRVKEAATTESLNIEHICRDDLDKADDGINKAVFYDGIDEGVSDVLRFTQEADDYFTRATGDIDSSRWSETYHTKEQARKKVDYHDYKLESGKMVKLTKAERVALELHSRNENSLRHILEGGIRLSTNPNILYKITGEDLDSITESLTPEEKKVAAAIHKYLNTIQKDKLNEVSVKLNGWEIATEPDYFPIRVHGYDIKRQHLLRGEALPSNMRAFTQSTLEGMGILKERVSASNALLLEDVFSATYKSIKQTSTYYGLAQPLRTAKAMLFDNDFRLTLNTRYGEHYWRALNNYIKDIEGEYQRTDNVDKMIMGWVNRLDIAILGLNPFVMLKQPVSFMGAATEMDSKYLLKALKAKPASREKMSKHSPQLRDRFEGKVTRELGEVAQVGQVRQFWTHMHTLGQKLMGGIRNFDYQAIGRIWNAVEYETETLHPDLKGDAYMEHVAKRTEEVVRLTQPTFHTKDRSSIGRSKSLWLRLATKYTSQRNKNYMMIFRAAKRYNRSNKSVKAKARLMKDLSILMLLMPLMLYGIDELRNLIYKRKKPKRRLRYFIFRNLENILGNVYLVGNVFRSLTSKVERGTYAGHDVSDVLTSSAETGINAMADTIRAIDQVVSQEKYKAGDRRGELKWKISAKRAIDESLSFNLRFRGIPYDTVKKLLIAPFRWVEEPKKKPSINFLEGYKKKGD